MNVLRNISFRGKLLLVVAATSFVTLLLACSALIGYDVISSYSAMRRDLAGLAEVVGVNSEAALVFGDARSGEENLASLRVRPHIMAAVLYVQDGTPLAVYSREGQATTPPPGRPQFEGIRETSGRIEMMRTIRKDGDVVGRVYICSDTREIQDRMAQSGLIGLLVMVASGLVGLLLSAHLQHLVSDPVMALVRAARHVSTKRDYSIRVETSARDELGTLTQQFNGMLEQIQTRDADLQEIQTELEVQLRELQEQIEQRQRAEKALNDSEEQLRQSQKMEAVGLLAGGVAHDFNNLLTIICGYSQMAVAKLGAGHPVAETLSAVKDAGDRAAVLTRQLLAFSRKQVMSLRPIELDGIVLNMHKMLKRILGEQIEIVVIPGLDGARVMADAGQIEQVILNLAVNARDAMPDGGKVTIRTADLTVAGDGDGGPPFGAGGRFVVLSVSDTGVGMDETTKARIFEPFFTTKGVGKGTGLGLSTVYGIVHQNGGHITVESAPGTGTTFRIYLPLHDAPAAEPSVGLVANEERGGSETILLVEDEAMVRRFTQEALEHSGYHVIQAAYGSEAVAIFEKSPDAFHLLLTDVVMPQMNGREVAKRIVELRPGLPVLYMSGYVGMGIIEDGLFDPEMNFIQKPFGADALLHRVRQLLDRSRGNSWDDRSASAVR